MKEAASRTSVRESEIGKQRKWFDQFLQAITKRNERGEKECN